MPALTLRLTQEEYDSLKLRSVIERKALVELIRNAITTYLEQQGSELEEMKKLVAAARAKGPTSREEAMRMAELGAHLDDQEGLGPLQVVHGDEAMSTAKRLRQRDQ